MEKLKIQSSEIQGKKRLSLSIYYAIKTFVLLLTGVAIMAAIWAGLWITFNNSLEIGSSQIPFLFLTLIALFILAIVIVSPMILVRIIKNRIINLEEWNEYNKADIKKNQTIFRKLFSGITLLALSLVCFVTSCFLPWGSMFGIEKGLPFLVGLFLGLPWFFPLAGAFLKEEIRYKHLTVLVAFLLFFIAIWEISSIKFVGRSANFEAGVYMYAVAIIILALGVIRYSLEYSHKLKQSK